jgi:ribonuclease Z
VRPLHHRIETYGYRLVEPDGRSLLPDRLGAAGVEGPDVGRLQREGSLRGVRLEDMSVPRPGQRFAFVMDTAPCDGAEALAEGAELLVAESTFSDEDAELAAQYRHLTAGQTAAWAPSSSPTSRHATATSPRWPSRRGPGPAGPPSWRPTTSTGSLFPNGVELVALEVPTTVGSQVTLSTCRKSS